MNSPAHILLADDDRALTALLAEYLQQEGFAVRAVHDGDEALRALADASFKPDVLVLDVMMPGRDGLDTLQKLRSLHALPVLMLSARGEPLDRVIGLELGADDYVAKPFSPKALVARIKALLRRLERTPTEGTGLYRYGPLTMDTTRHEVRLGNDEVPLTAKEFGLLEHLLRYPGRVLTRDILLNAVWGYDYYGTTRTVDVHIRRLKQKLPPLDAAIVSVKSLGYKLKHAAGET